MDGTLKKNVLIGADVAVVLKDDQITGTLTRGTVKALLTRSPSHPHGIKVRLTNGKIGRVKKIFS
ncbi:MAG: YwbE family protein [Campylobacteraceae bacterium]|nr:YwbE family protein [Campylobacteraceae bacterium]